MSEGTKRSRWGCGCLSGCLVVLLALVIGAIALFFFGKGWLIDRAQEQIPALSVVKQAKVSLDGDRSGSTSAGDFPSQIPLPPGASLSTFRTEEGRAHAVLRYEERPTRSLVDEVQAAMTRAGWKARKRQRLTDGLRLRFQKGKQRCELEVIAAGEGSELWVRWTAGEGEDEGG